MGGICIVDYNFSDYQNDFNGRDIDYGSITEDDKEELNLLSIQKSADIVTIISDILSYVSTMESIELIYNKYDRHPTRVPNPDVPAVQSLVLLLLARIVYTKIGFIRYDHLYERKINGEFEFSLEPEVNANISNILRTIGSYYGLLAAVGIYNRDLSGPILGV